MDVKHLAKLSEEAIADFVSEMNSRNLEGLYEPISYSLSLGGKRLRPLLCLMGYSLAGENIEDAIPAAVALEIFHNFTLLHDDVMDKADIRRGKPSVHAKWGSSSAILSGDQMLIEAYGMLARVPEWCRDSVYDIFTETATFVCEGQQKDMDFEKRRHVSMEDYLGMIQNKTSELIAGSIAIGGEIGGIVTDAHDCMFDYGLCLGQAFQLRDDYLDCFGDEATFGKKIGGDILCGKHTYLRVAAFEAASREQEKKLEALFADKNMADADKIKKVTAIYRELGADERCLAEIGRYCDMALEALDSLPSFYDAEAFRDMIEQLRVRES